MSRPALNLTPPARGTLEMIEAPRRAAALGRLVELQDSRGSGTRRGELTVKKYAGRYYPTCTRHGAMNAVGGDKWRCLVTGCNLGAEWPREASD